MYISVYKSMCENVYAVWRGASDVPENLYKSLCIPAYTFLDISVLQAPGAPVERYEHERFDDLKEAYEKLAEPDNS